MLATLWRWHADRLRWVPMLHTSFSDALPPVLAGPILRRLEPDRLVFWLVGSKSLCLTLLLEPPGGTVRRVPLGTDCCRIISIGRHAFLHLIDVSLPEPLPRDTLIHYDLLLHQDEGSEATMAQWAPHLLHDGETRPNLVLRSRADNILFGSCRKPHHPSRDGLARADELLAGQIEQPTARPFMLMLCGDQVYADDVAGPMLGAIHALIRRLGLYGECLEGAVVSDSEALYTHPASYYRREDLLPAFHSNEALRERFFGGVEKPVFTTANAHNHLVTLAEVMAQYLLVWSPVPWQLIDEPTMPVLGDEHTERWNREARALAGFRGDLPQVARLFAHVQTLMIFDDHDITDDWNLSARWESTAYNHPFSRRIVGNALLAYMLCQGWGNRPDAFSGLLDAANALTNTTDQQDRLEPAAQDALIGRLLAFNEWGYVLRTSPTVVVLDTRTRRWRSRRLASRGLAG